MLSASLGTRATATLSLDKLEEQATGDIRMGGSCLWGIVGLGGKVICDIGRWSGLSTMPLGTQATVTHSLDELAELATTAGRMGGCCMRAAMWWIGGLGGTSGSSMVIRGIGRQSGLSTMLSASLGTRATATLLLDKPDTLPRWATAIDRVGGR